VVKILAKTVSKMAKGNNYNFHIHDKFLPPRNTQFARHYILKKQREQTLKMRQVNLVAYDVSMVKSAPSPTYCFSKSCQCSRGSPLSEPDIPALRLPKTQRSPYAECNSYRHYTHTYLHRKPRAASSSTARYQRGLVNYQNYTSRQTRQISPTTPHSTSYNSDYRGLKQCYRKICNDDVESFKLLLKNQERFGKPKIPLSESHHNDRVVIHNNNNGSFPPKKAPFVPQTFLRGQKKKISVSPSHMHKLLTHKSSKSSSPVEAKPAKEKPSSTQNKQTPIPQEEKLPKITEPTVMISLPSTVSSPVATTTTTAADSTTMSRDEFISINESMLEDDLMAVPSAEGLLLSRSSSSVSNIIEDMIKDHKIKTENDDENVALAGDGNGNNQHTVSDEKEATSVSVEKPIVSDTDIVEKGLFASQEIGFQVMDENGEEEKNIIWHDPEQEQKDQEQSEAILNSSKKLAARRKSEIKQLLEEYSTIAHELDQMTVN